MARPSIALLGGHGGRSGVPRHIRQICNLLQNSYDITVYSDVDEGGYSFTANMNVTHIVIPGLTTTLNPTRLNQVWRTLRAHLDIHSHDVLWAHSRLGVTLARRYVQRTATRPRLIVTYHGSPFAGRSAAQRALVRSIERASINKTAAHDIVFLSHTDRKMFDGLKLHRHRIHEIGNCSDLGDLPPLSPPEHPTLIMTTRASRQKNLTAAALIFAHLPDDYRLILLGMGTQTHTREKFLRVLGAEKCERIRFGGPVDDVRPDLRRADAYLLTSRYEGMSIGAIEAFEAGLPVIMPHVGGAYEFAAYHPQSAFIDPVMSATAALTVHGTTTALRSDRIGHTTRNHAAWEKTFHPSVWASKITSLLALHRLG